MTDLTARIRGHWFVICRVGRGFDRWVVRSDGPSQLVAVVQRQATQEDASWLKNIPLPIGQHYSDERMILPGEVLYREAEVQP